MEIEKGNTANTASRENDWAMFAWRCGGATAGALVLAGSAVWMLSSSEPPPRLDWRAEQMLSRSVATATLEPSESMPGHLQAEVHTGLPLVNVKHAFESQYPGLVVRRIRPIFEWENRASGEFDPVPVRRDLGYRIHSVPADR